MIMMLNSDINRKSSALNRDNFRSASFRENTNTIPTDFCRQAVMFA